MFPSHDHRFGTGGDLRIYHDSANSYIQNITGALRIYNHVLDVRNDAGNETILKGSANGSVELYHNGTHMLSTASDGIQLQGDTKLSRHPNSNSPVLAVTNAQYAKSLFIGGWDGGTNSSGISRVRNSNDNLHIDSGSIGAIYLNAYSSGSIVTGKLQ